MKRIGLGSDMTRALMVMAVVCAALLEGAIFGHWPAGFYVLLRVAVCASALYMAGQAADIEQRGWAMTLVMVALVFNPLIPLRMTPQSWRLADGFTAMLMLAFAVQRFKQERDAKR